MKKKMSLLLTGILTLGLLSGCGGKDAESGTAAADAKQEETVETEPEPVEENGEPAAKLPVMRWRSWRGMTMTRR